MDYRQEVFGVGRSWFYLTLWHGTPPEFTEYIEKELEQVKVLNTFIVSTDGVRSSIDTVSSLYSDITKHRSVNVDIKDREEVSTDIITVTEVVWYVH